MFTVTVRPSGDTVGAATVMPVDGVKMTAVAPVRFCPLMVKVTAWPLRDTSAGETLSTDGPFENETKVSALDDCAGRFGGGSSAGLKKLSVPKALDACGAGFGGATGAGLKKLSVAFALDACAGGVGGSTGAGLKKLSVALALSFPGGGFGGCNGAGLKKLKVATVLSFPGGSGPPSPTRVTECGLPAALLGMMSDATRCAVTVGVNEIPIEQLAPPASVPVHVLLASTKFCAGLMLSVPKVTEIALVFVRLITTGAPTVPTCWPPRLSCGGTDNVPATPLPLRPTVCGLLRAELAMVNAPLRVPIAAGAKRTATLQLAPMASVPLQVLLVMLNSAVLVPTLLNVTARLPVLVTVTDWEPLAVPTS